MRVRARDLLVVSALVFGAGAAAPQGASPPGTVESDTAHLDTASAFNAGLAFAHDDRLGAAILAFERAHLQAPLDREIQDASAASRREARRRRAEALPNVTITEGEPAAAFWWRFFGFVPTQTAALLILVATWLTFGLLTLWRRTLPGARRDAILIAATTLGSIAIAAGAWWTGAALTARSITPAVVTDSSPEYRDAPDELSRPRRQPNLYEGAVVLIREERGAWTLVELVDRETVWVTARAVAAIAP